MADYLEAWSVPRREERQRQSLVVRRLPQEAAGAFRFADHARLVPDKEAERVRPVADPGFGSTLDPAAVERGCIHGDASHVEPHSVGEPTQTLKRT